jgi:pseudo-rSAM protein
MKQWNKSMRVLLNQDFPLEFVFNVTSSDDYQQVEQLIEQYQIEKYSLKPKYTGENIIFFRENVFLTKEDILSTSMSIKDFFSKQSINTHDFGKINIMPNGDAYANVNHPALGNIYTHGIHEIVQKELDEGRSWLRIRNQAPCSTCLYQWLCPSPSDHEIAIGRPNLCHVKQ